MASATCRDTTHGPVDSRDAYLGELRRHAHALVAMGYARLDPRRYQDSEEPDITGELANAMQEAMEDPEAPAWADHYTLCDDPPLNVEGKLGKRRPRVDIEFQRVQHGPRPRLRFEAKRLDPGHPATIYLGAEGMGCFLSGRYPAPTGEAGMLGYVQSGNEDVWASKIRTRLGTHARDYSMAPDGEWARQAIVTRMKHTYRTRHLGGDARRLLTIHHVLLRFC